MDRAWRENMNRTVVLWEQRTDPHFLIPRRVLACLIAIFCCTVAGLAQNATQPTNGTEPFSAHVTHLLGFESAPDNANGTLSIQDGTLQFQKDGKPAVKVEIAAVQDVFLGEQSKQVGGVPMTLGKAAVPFGGGRVVSLFSHKKYDTLSLEYVDTNMGMHGAIFQLNKGQGEILKNALVAGGAHVSLTGDEAQKQNTAEVPNESK
jgi:hypothetical protein